MECLTEKISDQRGSAMVIILIFAAFLIVTIAAVGEVVEVKQGARLKAKLADSRSLVLAVALRNTRTASYYYSTITRPDLLLDQDFVNCMIGDGLTPKCTTGGPRPLNLIDETSAATRVMGGSPETSVYYDIYGRVCQTPSRGMCVYELWAEYTAHCPRSGSPCFQAAVIDITITLKPIETIYPTSLLPLREIQAVQTVSISNFIDFYDPLFPPVVSVSGTPDDFAQGAPVASGTGPTGIWRKYVLPHSSTGLCIDSYSCSGSCSCTFSGVLPSSGGGSGGGGPSTATACGPGAQSVGGTCSPFSF